MDLHPRLVVRPLAAVARDAHVAGRDALHRAVVVVEDLRCREAREDLDPELLGLRREPAAEIAEAERVGALVAHERRHEPVRKCPLSRSAPSTQWWFSVTGTVSGEPLSFQSGISSSSALGIDHRARQDVRADLAPLLEDADGKLASGFVRKLLQADRRAQPGRTRADDNHVILHGFAVAHRSLSSRPPHNSTRLHCPFLDHRVNGGRGKARGWGSGIDRLCRGAQRLGLVAGGRGRCRDPGRAARLAEAGSR